MKDVQGKAGADASSKVVSLAAYRAARLQEREQLPLFAVDIGRVPAGSARALTGRDVAHRELMLRHLQNGG
jgi:hypothetical protein